MNKYSAKDFKAKNHTKKISLSDVLIAALVAGVFVAGFVVGGMIDNEYNTIAQERWNGGELNYQQAVMSGGLQLEGVLEYE